MLPSLIDYANIIIMASDGYKMLKPKCYRVIAKELDKFVAGEGGETIVGKYTEGDQL